jgi:regulatory protein
MPAQRRREVMTEERRIVTDIREAEDAPGRVSVYLDGRLAATMHAAAARRLRLAVGKGAPEDLADLARAEESQAAMAYAVRLLAQQDRTTAEIRDRLTRRGFAAEATRGTVARLTQQGYLNDRKLAEHVVRDALTRRPRGRRAIEWTLRKRGVPDEILTTCIEQHLAGVDETQIATKLAQQRLRRLQGLEPSKARTRLISFLARRGFGYETIQGALERVLPSAEQ